MLFGRHTRTDKLQYQVDLVRLAIGDAIEQIQSSIEDEMTASQNLVETSNQRMRESEE